MRFLFLTLLFCTAVFANTEKEIRTFQKCHIILTQKNLNPQHPAVGRIQKGQTGIKECRNLLSNALLSLEGDLVNRSNESLSVLKTLQAFHNNWFPRFRFNTYTQDHPNSNVFDKNEMAYHLTWALFHPDGKYSNIFTNSGSFVGIRESKVINKFTNDKNIGGMRYDFNKPDVKWMIGGVKEDPTEFGGEYEYKPELIPFGKLVGMRRMNSKNAKFQRMKKGKKTNTLNYKEPRFPGVIGTVPYLLLNAGHMKKTADGGNILHRRWSKSVFEDLLCREHPLINEEDSVSSVQKKSSIGFRQKNSCMNCHLPIDSLAGVLRNMELFNAGEVNSDYLTFKTVDRHPIKHPSLGKMIPDKDPFFHLRPPEGRLIFRTIDGKLISKSISNPEELGKTLSRLDAPYLCAAKRYFKFFTGIDVHLYDFKKFKVPDSEKNHVPAREYVIQLGRKLKEHQSLLKLSKEIIGSSYFTKGVAHE